MSSSNEWSLTRLDEACEIILGQSPPGESYNTKGEGLPFFQGKAEFQDLYPKAAKWCTQPSKVAEKNDILISVRAPVGPTNLCPERACIGRGLAALRPRDGIPSRYVLYAIRSNVRSLAEHATGSTFDAVSGSQLRAHAIPLAPSSERQRIVDRIEKHLTRLDAGVASLKRVQTALKRYRASVLKAACEGRLVPTEAKLARKEDRDYESADTLLQRILKERRQSWNGRGRYREPASAQTATLPPLPEGWTWAPMEAVSDAVGGFAFSSAKFSEKGYQVVKMANIRMGKIDLTQRPSFISDVNPDIIEKYSLREGDVVVTLTGTRKKRDYGYAAVVTGEEGLLLNQRIARVRSLLGLDSKFLQIAMQSEHYRNHFFAHETGNVGQGNVGMAAVTKEMITLPPLAEQTRIVAEVERRLSVVEELEAGVSANLQRATRLRQSILEEAFSGG